MKKGALITAVLVLMAICVWPASAEDVNKDIKDVKYTNDSVARLSFLDGKVFIQRPSDIGFEDGVLNSPIGEGDRVGTSDGRAEIRFGSGNYLRLDSNSKIDIMSLPKKDEDISRFRIWSGSVYLVVGTIRTEKGIEVHTPDSSFYVLDRGIYRIDVKENKNTEVQVYNGRLEAAGEGGSQVIATSHKLDMTEGRFGGKPAMFSAVAEDAFDKFNESRNTQVSKAVDKAHLSGDLKDFEGELDQYGQWVLMEPYGYVWVPNNMASDWKPYYDGRWVWMGLSGWTWLPYEPWGWATFHYGRWHWTGGYGWYWIPTSMWGPGWVDWWWDVDFIGWSPLSWWGYPGILLGGVYYGQPYGGGGYPIGSRSLTVIHRDQLKASNVSAVALKQDSLSSIKNISLSNKSFNMSPEGGKVTIQNIEGNRMILKKDASTSKLVSTDARTAPSPKSLPSGKTVSTASGSTSGAVSGTNSASGASLTAERKIRPYGSSSAVSGGSGSAVTRTATATGEQRVGNASDRSIKTYPSSASIAGTRAGAYGSSGRTSSGTSGSSPRTGTKSSGKSSGGSRSSGGHGGGGGRPGGGGGGGRRH